MPEDKNILPVQLGEERDKLERIAKSWGCPLAAAVRRLIREYRLEEGDLHA